MPCVVYMRARNGVKRYVLNTRLHTQRVWVCYSGTFDSPPGFGRKADGFRWSWVYNPTVFTTYSKYVHPAHKLYVT